MTGGAVAAITLALALSASTASAQSVYVTLCRTRFTVSDARGRLVTTLRPDDVVLYDNDVPQRLTDFRPHREEPLDVAVLADRSQSMSDHLSDLVSAAASFSDSLLDPHTDRGLVIAFDSKVYLWQDWTDRPGVLARSLLSLTPAGGTSLIDAIFKTCRDKFDISETRQNAILLLTDGEDTTSFATLDETVRMAALSRVVIYAIAVRGDSALAPPGLQGRRVLEALTTLTGGRVFYPSVRSRVELAALLATATEEMKSAYSVTYYLDLPPDDSFHRIRVEPRDRSLVVHAPTGYYVRALSTR